MLKLYNYFRSTASYRVRIALNYKELPYQLHEIHLVNGGGEQFSAEYQTINPQSLVPSLVDDNIVIHQSIAIIEYLEERYPKPALLPNDPVVRAHIRSLAQIIACDIHPLNNLRVLKYLKNDIKVTDKQKQQWYHYWIIQGFTAIEKILQQQGSSGKFCFGNKVTLADIVLIPQVYNANRFNCSLDNFPLIKQINDHCLTLSYFANAAPGE